MPHNPFAPAFEDLPPVLPVFPLAGVLLLPTGQLPLNIFEPRYLQMVRDALAGPRLIGMIQPREAQHSSLYEIGCAGKIIEFSETTDGRYLITLHGICRFRIQTELKASTPYRQITPDWSPFPSDIKRAGDLALDRTQLKELLARYFSLNDLSCDWKKIDDASDDRLITCLSMVCPFSPCEKQALLEAPDIAARAQMFMTMLEMEVRNGGNPLSKPH